MSVMAFYIYTDGHVPAYKKDNPFDKENYQSISLLSRASKISRSTKYFSNKLITTQNLNFRLLDRFSVKWQYTAMFVKNVRKIEKTFRQWVLHWCTFYGPIKSI